MNIKGFSEKIVREIKELDGKLHEMEHDKTGAKLVWLERDEENKTFGIAFETLPWNDTGVFHILEHSVLCGSDKYPVKEPFVELLKTSMNTFLNAMTFPDKTIYPVCSRNDKDFINLVRVYMDAVLHPMIYKRPEIFRQEGWHYELDENGVPSYNGVVFNEMKGAYASADELSDINVRQMLFPDVCYGFEAGGDPASIPDLTYEDFIEAHKKHYSPSNSYIYLDGKMDIEAVLGILDGEYLSEFERGERLAPPDFQKPTAGGRREVEYELSAEEKLEGRTRFTMAGIACRFDEREKLIALRVLSDVLCGSNQALLTKPILDSGLAEEVVMYVQDGVLQPWMCTELRNLKAENVEKAKALCVDTLKKLAAEGIDREKLRASMANLEFKLRERDFGTFPCGLFIGINVMETWLYGGDPAANIEVGDVFEVLEKKAENGYFEQLLKDVLLENPGSCEVVLTPSHTAGEKRNEKEKARLAAESARWDDAEKERVKEIQKKLDEWQSTPDSPEALASLPMLKKEDIEPEPEKIPTEAVTVGELPFIRHTLSTSGISYVTMYFDAGSCTEDELKLMSLLCQLLTACDTKSHTADQLQTKARLLCGNLSFHNAAFSKNNCADKADVFFCAAFSALTHNVEKAAELVTEILTETCFDNEQSLLDILRQYRAALYEGMIMSGHAMAISRVSAQYSVSGVVSECTGGFSAYRFIKDMEDNWDGKKVGGQLSGLLKKLVRRCGLTVSVTDPTPDTDAKIAGIIREKLPDDGQPKEPPVQLKPWGKRKEGIIIPADVSFAVRGANLNEYGGKFSGGARAAANIIRFSYLWNVIRVQGGAYGTGLDLKSTGVACCYSYRDPGAAGSLKSYLGAADFLREFSKSDPDLTGCVISTIAGASPLLTPHLKGLSGDSHYWTGYTFEDRCRHRREIIDVTCEQLAQIADSLEKTLENGSICVIGGKKLLDECGGFDSVMSL